MCVKAPSCWLSVYTRSAKLFHSHFTLSYGLRCCCLAYLSGPRLVQMNFFCLFCQCPNVTRNLYLPHSSPTAQFPESNACMATLPMFVLARGWFLQPLHAVCIVHRAALPHPRAFAPIPETALLCSQFCRHSSPHSFQKSHKRAAVTRD